MAGPGPVRRRQRGVGRPTVQRASLPLPLPVVPTGPECAALLKALIKHLLFQRAQIPYLYDELLRVAQAQQQAEAEAEAAEAAACGNRRRRRRRSPKGDKRLLKFLGKAEELLASIDAALTACGVPRRAFLMLGASSAKPREVFEVLLPQPAPAAAAPQGLAAAAAAAAGGLPFQQQGAAAQEAAQHPQAASRARPSRQQRLCQLAVRHLVVGAAELPEGTAHTVPCKLFVLLEGPPASAAGSADATADAAAEAAAVAVPPGFTTKRQFRLSMRKGTHVRLLLGQRAQEEEQQEAEQQQRQQQQAEGAQATSGEASMDGSGCSCSAGEGQAEAGTVHLSQLPDADSQGTGQQPSSNDAGGLPPAGAAVAPAPAASSTTGSVWFMARTVLKGLNNGSSSGGVAAGFDGLGFTASTLSAKLREASKVTGSGARAQQASDQAACKRTRPAMCAWACQQDGTGSSTSGSVAVEAAAAAAAAAGGTVRRDHLAADAAHSAQERPALSTAAADAAWREAKAVASFDARLQLFPLLTHGATQAITLLSGWRGMPAAEISQRVASTLVVALFWVLPTFWPVQYMRHRTLCLVSSRISFFAWPLLRKPRGIQQVLDAAAEPGLRGALRDVFKIVWGARLVAVVLLSFITPLSVLPLTTHLLLQLYAVLMVRGNSSLCAAPLLRDPLTQERIRRFHFVMGLLATALPGGVGSALRARTAHSMSETAACEAFLTCLSAALAALLPAYLAVKTEPATSLQRWEEARLARAARDGAASTSLSDSAWEAADASPGGSSGQNPCRLAGLLARVEASVGSGIRYIFCGGSWLAEARPPSPGAAPAAGPAGAAGLGRPKRDLFWYERLVAWWLLLALVYELAVVTNA